MIIVSLIYNLDFINCENRRIFVIPTSLLSSFLNQNFATSFSENLGGVLRPRFGLKWGWHYHAFQLGMGCHISDIIWILYIQCIFWLVCDNELRPTGLSMSIQNSNHYHCTLSFLILNTHSENDTWSFKNRDCLQSHLG